MQWLNRKASTTIHIIGMIYICVHGIKPRLLPAKTPSHKLSGIKTNMHIHKQCERWLWRARGRSECAAVAKRDHDDYIYTFAFIFVFIWPFVPFIPVATTSFFLLLLLLLQHSFFFSIIFSSANFYVDFHIRELRQIQQKKYCLFFSFKWNNSWK